MGTWSWNGRRAGLGVALAVVVGIGIGSAACRPSDAGAGTEQSGAAEPLRAIQHEEPRRDFVGPQPVRYRWSAIAGADRYALGLWNEADRLIWRRDDLTEPSVAWPAEAQLEPGTYFWSVSALQGEREIAKSGLAAFVVEQ